MKKITVLSALFLMAMGFMSYGQETGGTPSTEVETNLIAVVNRANWCGICKANGERFGNNLMFYASRGVTIIINDLTDSTSIAQSQAKLKESSVYRQIYKANRKGIGRMMQACGILHGKDKSMIAGIVTFIDAKRLKVLSTSSIAVTDEEMRTLIDNLLK